MTTSSPSPPLRVSYLVTGLPCLLARRIVEQILCFEPKAVVQALVHEDELDVARSFLEALDEPQRARVNVLSGDPTALDWGLSGSECSGFREVRPTPSP